LTDAASLEEEFSRIREQGYAIDDEEIMDSLKCVAAPIRDQSGKVISAISLSGPISRMQGEHFQTAVTLVTKTAGEVSASLGYREEGKSRTNEGLAAIPLRG
jgi:DNA-binding IclR family transcriptional regulator